MPHMIAVALFWVSILALIAIPAYRAYYAAPASASHRCSLCGTQAIPRRRVPGSPWITFLLLCCGIVPGLIYALWRSSAAASVCPACGSQALIPLGTPAAARM
jgi:predicted RNA-binding Zn-ribbon protein involved in translation (DUF1610 family)